MLEGYKPGDPVYTVEGRDTTIGMVYCARHSKGGHLENLAVDPEYQGFGFGGQLVKTLLHDNPGLITLTTRVPHFFERFGFCTLKPLSDGAMAMYFIPRAN